MFELIQSVSICTIVAGGLVGLVTSKTKKKDDNKELQDKIDRVDEALKSTNLKITKDDTDLFVTATSISVNPTQERYNLVIPYGLSFDSLLKKQDVIENVLKCKVKLVNQNYNYSLIIEDEVKLKDKYPFEIIKINNQELQVVIGMTRNGPLIVNLSSNTPHGLIGGTSGGGKSRLIKGLLLQLMENYDSSQLKLVFLDNKGGVEGNTFLNCEHFEFISNSVYETVSYLGDLKNEMESRLIQIRNAKVTNIIDYNNKFKDAPLPFKLIVLDELYPFLALKNKQKIYENLADLLSRGRAAGIHFLIATQKTTTDVLPSFISANTALIIGMKTRNSQESLNILSRPGLENINIKGRGFCLTDKEVEFQSFWVDDGTIENICKKHIKKTDSKPTTRVIKTINTKEEKPLITKSKLL
ncbi:FtsK/SpoIIIE domain-containing protein [Turicibacter sanguinis]|uniref:FtsK/SpoIIIE domain-containing protein n=1 Tax=Turicibacter sanguinis TaxID=154288 RepID=UPI001896ADC8|nr:FtsK/SpoIIIE domain-containing protein [Turicibacter sanguinis]